MNPVAYKILLQNYHPFGMPARPSSALAAAGGVIKERSMTSAEYRFGFNGYENETEICCIPFDPSLTDPGLTLNLEK